MAYLSTTGDLSPETQRVLQLAATGLGAGAIAERLGCERAAVQRHLADAVEALSASSVPDALRIAARRGVIEASGPET